MEKRKLFKESIQTNVDVNTGETVEISTTEMYFNEKEPNYVKMYLEDLSLLAGLNKTEIILLIEMLKSMAYNGLVVNNKYVKEQMCEVLNLKYNTLDKALKTLHKKDILVRKAKGMYHMNPMLFGKGSWKNIKEIRVSTAYTNKGITKETEFIREPLDVIKQHNIDGSIDLIPTNESQ